jgi:RNA polymerase sigma-70 factor, ECF subfamily
VQRVIEAPIEVPEELDERALIERCRAGDDAAFAELVDRYKNLVYGLVYRMSADRSQADDLAQDVFLKVYRGLPYFRGDAQLSTWIYRIVRNVCAETRPRRAPDRSLDEEDRYGRRLDPGTPDGVFADLELRDRLEKAIAQLPENYRFLIAAHYLQGVRYEALAESLNLPLGTVKTHLYRAKRRLRELLDA